MTRMFDEPSGKTSIMRVSFAVVLLVVLLNWSYANYINKTILPLPDNSVALVIGLAGAKTFQRFGERMNEKLNPPTE